MSKKVAAIVAFLLFCVSCRAPVTIVTASVREPLTNEERLVAPHHLIYPLTIDKSENGSMRCTGTYIGNNHFLTAGHCMTDRNGRINSTKSATVETNADSHTVAFKMYKKTIFHKKPFKPMQNYAGFHDFKNDVGLIKVTEPSSIPLDTSTTPLTVHKNLQSLVGKTVSTIGYSRYFKGDMTKTQGTVLNIEEDGTLTVDFYIAEQNSGSPVYYNGKMIGIVTGAANVTDCQDVPMCSKATITPFTMDMKSKLFDRNGISVSVAE
ncbi:trypsin-like serine peptidase [Streptococcus ruminantium]|uniref:trypsin-like serine peptidase n=1 Tax=Streptococcus ruminantium TaxID=1917441 RepID=UPI0012DECD00|nr:trypsin-like serine protease [Streptococcus ruminantium]